MKTYYERLYALRAEATRMRRELFPAPASDLYIVMCRLELALDDCIYATPEGQAALAEMEVAITER